MKTSNTNQGTSGSIKTSTTGSGKGTVIGGTKGKPGQHQSPANLSKDNQTGGQTGRK